METYTTVIRQAAAAAAALEAFEAAYIGIIEDSATIPTLETREKAFEMFCIALDAATDFSATVSRCKAGFMVGELYTMASDGDKAIIQRILEKYRA